MQPVLAIAFREIIGASNLKQMQNIGFQQNYLSKKERILLLFEVSFIFFNKWKTSELYLCFILKEFE